MSTKKEYSPIRMTLVLSALLVILAASYFLIANSRYGSLSIGYFFGQGEETENEEGVVGEEEIFLEPIE